MMSTFNYGLPGENILGSLLFGLDGEAARTVAKIYSQVVQGPVSFNVEETYTRDGFELKRYNIRDLGLKRIDQGGVADIQILNEMVRFRIYGDEEGNIDYDVHDRVLGILDAYLRRLNEIRKYDVLTGSVRQSSRPGRSTYNPMYARDNSLPQSGAFSIFEKFRSRAKLETIKFALAKTKEVPLFYSFDKERTDRLVRDLQLYGPPEYRLRDAPPVPEIVYESAAGEGGGAAAGGGGGGAAAGGGGGGGAR